MANLYAIKQVITAGSNFDASLPSTTPVTANGIKAYPTDTGGGLFDLGTELGNTTIPISIINIEILLGGQSAWVMNVADAAGDAPLISGTTETAVFYAPVAGKVVLLPGQTLELTTTGASGAMYCYVVFAPAGIGGY